MLSETNSFFRSGESTILAGFTGGKKLSTIGLIHPRKFLAVLGWRLSGDFLEDTVEMGEGLEADFKRHLGNTNARLEEQDLRRFDAGSRNILGEGQSRGLLELFTKVTSAEMGAVGDFLQGERLGEMLFDILPCPLDRSGLRTRTAEDELPGNQ